MAGHVEYVSLEAGSFLLGGRCCVPGPASFTASEQWFALERISTLGSLTRSVHATLQRLASTALCAARLPHPLAGAFMAMSGGNLLLDCCVLGQAVAGSHLAANQVASNEQLGDCLLYTSDAADE